LDVHAAYNILDEPEAVLVYPPREWLDEQAAQGLPTNVMWRMLKIMPGRRIAAKLWVDYLGEVHRSFGFEQCPGFRQFFHHKERGISCEIHMDDVHGCGPTNEVDAHILEMKSALTLKRATRHSEGDVYQHLKRFRHLHPMAD